MNAQEAVYDIIINSMADGLNTLAPGGCLRDLMTMPVLTLDSDWWSRSCHNNLEILGKQYITSGPISLDYYYAPCVIAFNQRIADENQKENLYDIVLSGKWTIDELGRQMKDVARDLNGDSEMTEDDLYGFACDDLTGQALFIGCGGTQTETDSDGIPYLTMANEKNISILDKIISVVAKDGERLLVEAVLWNKKETDAFRKTYHFKNGQAYMLGYNMSGMITYLRDMKDDYGLIPMPKYDESQSDYLTYGSPWGPCGVAVPVTVGDECAELVGTAMEMLAYISYTTVGTEMYNVTLQEKVARDEKSKETLEIIYRDVIFDLNGIHNFGETGILLRSCAIGAEENFVSKYAKKSTTAQKRLDELVKQFRSIEY